MRIPRLRANSVADALPVVFCRRGNTVPVITPANFVGGLKLAKRILHRSKLRLGRNSGLESCRNVLRCTVNALYVLQQANDLCDRLGQRMFKLLRNGRVVGYLAKNYQELLFEF